eukprot:COSAG01_NODE_4169_length_5274_cov_8.543575_6_plen_100_part_00
MEFRLAQHFMRTPDFVDGVNAVLTKGSGRPAWAAAPSAAEVQQFFEAAGCAGMLPPPRFGLLTGILVCNVCSCYTIEGPGAIRAADWDSRVQRLFLLHN